MSLPCTFHQYRGSYIIHKCLFYTFHLHLGTEIVRNHNHLTCIFHHGRDRSTSRMYSAYMYHLSPNNTTRCNYRSCTCRLRRDIGSQGNGLVHICPQQLDRSFLCKYLDGNGHPFPSRSTSSIYLAYIDHLCRDRKSPSTFPTSNYPSQGSSTLGT